MDRRVGLARVVALRPRWRSVAFPEGCSLPAGGRVWRWTGAGLLGPCTRGPCSHAGCPPDAQATGSVLALHLDGRPLLPGGPKAGGLWCLAAPGMQVAEQGSPHARGGGFN